MPQAVCSHSNDAASAAMGNLPVHSRRGALGLAALALVAPAVALAVPPAPPAGPPTDAGFWAEHRRLVALEAAWAADGDDSDENWARHSAVVDAQFNRVMTIPVFSAAALLAKYDVCQGQDVNLPGPVENTLEMFRQDLQRIAAQELAR